MPVVDRLLALFIQFAEGARSSGLLVSTCFTPRTVVSYTSVLFDMSLLDAARVNLPFS